MIAHIIEEDTFEELCWSRERAYDSSEFERANKDTRATLKKMYSWDKDRIVKENKRYYDTKVAWLKKSIKREEAYLDKIDVFENEAYGWIANTGKLNRLKNRIIFFLETINSTALNHYTESLRDLEAEGPTSYYTDRISDLLTELETSYESQQRHEELYEDQESWIEEVKKSLAVKCEEY